MEHCTTHFKYPSVCFASLNCLQIEFIFNSCKALLNHRVKDYGFYGKQKDEYW